MLFGKVDEVKYLESLSKEYPNIQHGGRPSAFRQNSADCHAETNSSFQMQMIRDGSSNHDVH